MWWDRVTLSVPRSALPELGLGTSSGEEVQEVQFVDIASCLVTGYHRSLGVSSFQILVYTEELSLCLLFSF